MSLVKVKELLENDSVKAKLQEIIGKNSASFATSVVQIVNDNKSLAKCDPKSILGAAMNAATMNLPINDTLGFAYIVPYGNQAQFQIGWKGLWQLALRSKVYKTIETSDVREGEKTSHDRLTGAIVFNWEQDDDKRAKLSVIGYVAYYLTHSGLKKTVYMTVNEINQHAKEYSQTFKKGFGTWKDNFDAMAKKTVLKLLLGRYGELTIDGLLETAIKTDQGSFVDELGEDFEYIDNQETDHVDERLTEFIETAKTLDELNTVVNEEMNPVQQQLFKDKENELQ